MKKVISIMLLLVLLHNRSATCMAQNSTSAISTDYKIFAVGVSAGAAVVSIAWYWWHQKVNIPEEKKLMNSIATLAIITQAAILGGKRVESENKLLKEENKRLMRKLDNKIRHKNERRRGVHRIQQR